MAPEHPAALVGLLLLCAGCTRQAPSVDARGLVQIDGAPAAALAVQFTPMAARACRLRR
jgi:hypothetical protein